VALVSVAVILKCGSHHVTRDNNNQCGDQPARAAAAYPGHGVLDHSVEDLDLDVQDLEAPLLAGRLLHQDAVEQLPTATHRSG
jgi:hypothetical protein